VARASPVGRPTAGRRTCPGARPSRGSRPAGSRSDPAARADRHQLLCCTRPCFSMSLSTLTIRATFHKSCPGRGTTGHWYRGAARSGRCGRRSERDAAAEPPRRPSHEAGAPARAPCTARERPPRWRSCATHAARSCSAGGPPPAACAPSPAGTSPAWTSRLRAAPRGPFGRPAVGPAAPSGACHHASPGRCASGADACAGCGRRPRRHCAAAAAASLLSSSLSEAPAGLGRGTYWRPLRAATALRPWLPPCEDCFQHTLVFCHTLRLPRRALQQAFAHALHRPRQRLACAPAMAPASAVPTPPGPLGAPLASRPPSTRLYRSNADSSIALLGMVRRMSAPRLRVSRPLRQNRRPCYGL